jgi:hypothetical protein
MEEAVRNAPLFLAFDEEASVALRASMVEIDFTRGQVIFAEGDPGDRLYVIVDGKIKLGTTQMMAEKASWQFLDLEKCLVNYLYLILVQEQQLQQR